MLAGVGAAGQPAILHHLADVSGAIREAGHTVDDDRVLTQPSAAVVVLRVEAREDLVIAAEVDSLVSDG